MSARRVRQRRHCTADACRLLTRASARAWPRRRRSPSMTSTPARDSFAQLARRGSHTLIDSLALLSSFMNYLELSRTFYLSAHTQHKLKNRHQHYVMFLNLNSVLYHEFSLHCYTISDCDRTTGIYLHHLIR